MRAIYRVEDRIWKEQLEDEPDSNLAPSFLWTDRAQVVVDPEAPVDAAVEDERLPWTKLEEEYREMGLQVSRDEDLPLVQLKASKDLKEQRGLGGG